jgi:hypothetical protein
MTILVLSLGNKTGWATYSHDKATKINSGCYQFKCSDDEKGDQPFERFYKYFDEILYNHSPIETIYYQKSNNGNYKLYRKCIEYLLNKDIKTHKFKSESIEDESKLVDHMKSQGYTPDTGSEASAIATIRYVSTISN